MKFKRSTTMILVLIFAFVATMSSFTGVTAFAAGVPNLVSNSTFSNGLTGWTNGGSIGTILNQGVDDTKSVRINATSSSNYFAFPVTVVASTEYVITYYSRGTGAITAGIGQGSSNQIMINNNPSTYWIKNKVYVTTGAYTTTNVQFKPNGTGTVDIDKVSIYKYSEAPADPQFNEYLGPNIVKNGDFETVNVSGVPMYWGNQVGTGRGYNGTSALVLNGSNGYPQQNIDMTAYIGKVMRTSFKVKFTSMASNAQISIQDALGKWSNVKFNNGRTDC